MAKLGVAELYTESGGWVEVDLYESTDFSFAPIEMPVGDGTWGVPYLTDPASADTPIEVYTSANGWQGINTVGYVLVDDYEDANLDEWVESQDSGVEVTTGRAAFQGDYGLKTGADTCERALAAPDITPNLPYYPQPGDVWEVFIRLDADAAMDEAHAIGFGAQTYPTTNGYDSLDVTDQYKVWLDLRNFSDGAFRLIRETNNEWDTNDTDTSVTLAQNQWYRVEIDWRSTSSDLKAALYEVTKDDWTGTQVASANIGNDTTYGQGAIEFAGIGGVHWDLARKTAPL